jgi:hypothetical protein
VKSHLRTWCGRLGREPARLDAQVAGPSSSARELTFSLRKDIRLIGPVNVDQNWSAPMSSPPARVERELKILASIVPLSKSLNAERTSWAVSIREEGPAKTVSLLLFVVTKEADAEIQAWLTNGENSNGEFKVLTSIQGAYPIDHFNNLQVRN